MEPMDVGLGAPYDSNFEILRHEIRAMRGAIESLEKESQKLRELVRELSGPRWQYVPIYPFYPWITYTTTSGTAGGPYGG